MLLASLLGLAAAAPAVLAQSPGGAPAKERPEKPAKTADPAEPAPAPSPAAPADPAAPRLTSFKCKRGCSGPAAARPRATLDVRGRAISTVESVVFLGAAGEADDITVLAGKVTRKRVLVRVPRFAASGPLAVVTADGAQSAPTRAPLTVEPPAQRSSGPAPAIEAEVRSPRVFVDGLRRAALDYVVRDSGPVDVTVELVRASDGAVVLAWPTARVEPGVVRSVMWDGAVAGAPQAPGRYEFRVTARDGSGAQASSVQAPPPGSRKAAPPPGGFELLDHQFPIRGAHRLGSGAAAFGGGRGHQGHDVFAACGTPLVAARGGRVKFRQYHSRAGNYLVVDGDGTGVDYAYMHLRDAPPVKVGDRVRTGQPIGHVGDTGRASGCHLHFEMWTAPGWYDGGSPVDPLPFLRVWDRTS